jgi:ABC-type multidrug transport system permease subunit
VKVIWALTKKELRLLVRDPIALILLLGMPLLFTLVEGILLGENFGQKADDTLRISLVDLDERDENSESERLPAGRGLKGRPWSYWVLKDLKETPGIRVEIIPSREEAERLVRDHRRAAVLVLERDFSERLNHCSFLDTPSSVNPFHRDGVYLDPDDPGNLQKIDLGVRMLKDQTQISAAAIIEQVIQVCMLRVVLPFMIGQAFNKLSDDEFIERLGQEVNLPVPADFPQLYNSAEKLLKDPRVGAARLLDSKLNQSLTTMQQKLKAFRPLAEKDRVQLAEMLHLAAGSDEKKAAEYRDKVGLGVKKALARQFNKYNLTGGTWAELNRLPGREETETKPTEFVDQDGTGLLRRGAHRYQLLVPAFTVMFAFFLVLIVGWIFVTERRQGTLLRLRAAPLTRAQILLGKLIPCFLVSVGQGAFLLLAGRLLFGMRWGPDDWPLAEQAGWLLLVVACTSLAAMGLALLVASLARTEIQVALYGAVPVLVLALVGGCLLPREMMPEQTQRLSLLTPQGWALDAYRELLNSSANYRPNLTIVMQACAALVGFAGAFLALAWGLLRLE